MCLDEMLRNINEQPSTLAEVTRLRRDFIRATARLPGLAEGARKRPDLGAIDRIIITGCGSSWNASLIGEYLIEEYARIPVEVEYASEFRYRNPIIGEHTLVFAASQTGENKDTIAAMKEVQDRGAICMGICNVEGSTIARESDGGVYLHTGPEIDVASTKAFTAQVTVFDLIAILLARKRTMSVEQGSALLKVLDSLPEAVNRVLEISSAIRDIAQHYYERSNCLFLGRGRSFPVALEGALKFNEVCGIHAEGYPAAEMKHGPIALIDENMPVVVIAPKDSVYDKIRSNIQEVKARRGNVIAIATKGDTAIKELVDHVIYLPDVDPLILPQVEIIALQLLTYHVANLRQQAGVSYLSD